MPQLGESVAEGTIGKWLKKPGDHVTITYTRNGSEHTVDLTLGTRPS